MNAMNSALVLRENNIDKYVAEIKKYPVLSREDEFALAVRFHDHGDVDAARALVVANLRFVVKVAHEFRGYNMKILDLIQEGNIGLMMAVKKFDPHRGYRLISYAVWWIRAYIKSFILRSWSSVKLGTTQASRKLFFKLRSAKSEMTDAEGDAPSQQDLATELGVTTADVEEMELRLAARDFSLDAEPLDGGRAKIDALASHDDNQEERYGEEESRQQIASNVSLGLKELSDKERYIVEQRYLADEPKTLGEIGDEFGVSRERVRQLEVRAMSKLRAAMPADAASLVR